MLFKKVNIQKPGAILRWERQGYLMPLSFSRLKRMKAVTETQTIGWEFLRLSWEGAVMEVLAMAWRRPTFFRGHAAHTDDWAGRLIWGMGRQRAARCHGPFTYTQLFSSLKLPSSFLPPGKASPLPIKNTAQNLVNGTRAHSQPQSGCIIFQSRLITWLSLGNVSKRLLSELV